MWAAALDAVVISITALPGIAFLNRFYDEVCFDREMIAYLALRDRETDHPHMVLVVQNAFDPEQYYREFALEIDPSLVPSAPVREAKFSADHTQLSFVYYASVEDFAEDRKTPMTVEL